MTLSLNRVSEPARRIGKGDLLSGIANVTAVDTEERVVLVLTESPVGTDGALGCLNRLDSRPD